MSTSTNSKIKVQLLGGLRVTRGNGDAVDLGARQYRRIVARLAFDMLPRSRGELAAQLWPEHGVSLESKLKRLRTELSALRQVLKSCESEDASPEYIQDVGDGVRLNTELVDCDIVEYRHYLQLATDETNPRKRRLLLSAVIAQYGGDLLPDFEEDWIPKERKSLRESRQRVQRLLDELNSHRLKLRLTLAISAVMIFGVLFTSVAARYRSSPATLTFISLQVQDEQAFAKLKSKLDSLRSPNANREADQARRRQQARACAEIAELAWNSWWGPDEHLWIERVRSVWPDMRAAIKWSSKDKPEIAIQICGALPRYWQLCGEMSAGGDWLENALGKNAPVDDPFRARALVGAMLLQWENVPLRDTLEQRGVQSLAFYRLGNDRWGEAYALRGLGVIANAHANSATALKRWREALSIFLQIGDERGEAACMLDMTHISAATALLRAQWSLGALRLKQKVGNQAGIREAVDQSYRFVMNAAQSRTDGKERDLGNKLMRVYLELEDDAQSRRATDTERGYHGHRLRLAHAFGDKQALAEELVWFSDYWRRVTGQGMSKEYIRSIQLYGAALALLRRSALPERVAEQAEWVRNWDTSGSGINERTKQAIIRNGMAIPVDQAVEEATSGF